jgi:uncharacterized phage-associated protein
MTASDSDKLSQWILANTPFRDHPMTHLKLQKLMFYCYGAALAFGCESAVGDDIHFEAWAHGPVCRSLWHVYKDQGARPIDWVSPSPDLVYSEHATKHLTDVLAIYSAMSAWALRQESHTEAPWDTAWKQTDKTIARDVLRTHFACKFAGSEVHLPEYLSNASNARLDGIPVRGYRSLAEVANAVRRISPGT